MDKFPHTSIDTIVRDPNYEPLSEAQAILESAKELIKEIQNKNNTEIFPIDMEQASALTQLVECFSVVAKNNVTKKQPTQRLEKAVNEAFINAIPTSMDQTIVTPHRVTSIRIPHVQQGHKYRPPRVEENQDEIEPVTREDSLE